MSIEPLVKMTSRLASLGEPPDAMALAPRRPETANGRAEPRVPPPAAPRCPIRPPA